MQDDVAIKVHNLHKTFELADHKQNSIKHILVNPGKRSKKHRQKVLNGVDFEIKKGEFFGIVGRNGSGKSTLLKLLAGVYAPDSGAVEVNGKLTPFIELGVGFNPELSGRDNVYLSASLLGFTRKQVDEMYDDIVSFAELEDHMDKKLKNYSSGMQVRLAFSIAIRSKSDILLIDEVLAVGDAIFQQKCFDYFNKLKNSGITVIFVSHDISSINKYCTKAMYLKGGEVAFMGKPEYVTDEYGKDLLEKDSQQSGNVKNSSTAYNSPVKISSVKTISSSGDKKLKYDQGEEIIIRCEYSVYSNIKEPIFGILIFPSNSNVPVFGVNTVEPNKLASIRECFRGDKVIFEISIENRFTGGRYVATTSVASSSGLMVYDKIERRTCFISNQTKNNFAAFQSKYKLKIKRT